MFWILSPPNNITIILNPKSDLLLRTKKYFNAHNINYVVNDKKENLQDLIVRFVDEIESKYSNPGSHGLKTGFNIIDVENNGLHPGELYLFAGRPSMGKSTFALNIASNVLENNKRVLFFSFEMPAIRMIEKMCSAMGDIDYQKIQNGDLKDVDWVNFTEFLAVINKLDFVIDDKAGQTIDEIVLKAKVENNKKKLDLVIVDYLQLIYGTGHSKNEQVGDISSKLKVLSKQINTPVIALSQLNRGVELRANKRPLPSDLRDSGSLEQDADLILFIYRDEIYYPNKPENKNIAELIIAKTRYGVPSTETVRVELSKSRFLNEKGE